MSDRVLIAVLLILFGLPYAHAQDAGFDCDSASLFVSRLSVVPSDTVLPDSPNTRLLASQDFVGFAKYGIDSVKLTIRFDPDSHSTAVRPTGSIRIAAVVRSGAQATESEIRYSASELAFLRARLISDDPAPDNTGTPAIRVEQAEADLPVILIKFIGVVAAGGWGDVNSHNAMVIDFRGGKLLMPAALGCVDNDFAGQGARGGSANCQWNHTHQDYGCTTSEGDFFLISGKKIVSHRNDRTQKNIEQSAQELDDQPLVTSVVGDSEVIAKGPD